MTRPLISLLVSVTVPEGMTVEQVRKEIRCLVNEQCNWAANPEDIRIKGVRALPDATKRKKPYELPSDPATRARFS